MPHVITIEVPDESFKVMVRKAAQAGQTPEEWALARLRAFAPTDKEREEGIQRILGRVDAGGNVSVGNEHNEAIDRDLAREYAGAHQDKP